MSDILNEIHLNYPPTEFAGSCITTLTKLGELLENEIVMLGTAKIYFDTQDLEKVEQNRSILQELGAQIDNISPEEGNSRIRVPGSEASSLVLPFEMKMSCEYEIIVKIAGLIPAVKFSIPIHVFIDIGNRSWEDD